MTLTTTQLAGMSDEQLIELASTDLERELVRRLDASQTKEAETASHYENLEVEGLDDALEDLETLSEALDRVRTARVRLKTFIESL